jgi:cytochrome bd-type quinol oxidase subunit 2
MTGYRPLSTIFVFGRASAALASLFGVALGNVMWGLPMDANGSFFNQHEITGQPHALANYSSALKLLAFFSTQIHAGKS